MSAPPTREMAVDHNSTTMWMPPGSSEIKLRTKTLFALGPIATIPYRTYQGAQIHSCLRGMASILPEPPETYTSLHLNTPFTFARLVKDFVALKCAENSNGKDAQRFFVFHPDTAWVGAFQRLCELEGPLSLEFAGISHNLFVLARWMLCERVALVQALGDAGRKIRFHVLVPAAEALVIPHSISFVNALEPLVIDGPICKGRPLVWFKLAPGSGVVLRDVGVIPPVCPVLAEGKAFTAVCLLCIVASPLIMLACKAFYLVHCPFYVALALSLLLHGLALNATMWLKRQITLYYMQEDTAIILG